MGDTLGVRKSPRPTAKKPPQNRLPPGPQRPLTRGKGQTRARGLVYIHMQHLYCFKVIFLLTQDD